VLVSFGNIKDIFLYIDVVSQSSPHLLCPFDALDSRYPGVYSRLVNS
jgi:hypothetical protein